MYQNPKDGALPFECPQPSAMTNLEATELQADLSMCCSERTTLTAENKRLREMVGNLVRETEALLAVAEEPMSWNPDIPPGLGTFSLHSLHHKNLETALDEAKEEVKDE